MKKKQKKLTVTWNIISMRIYLRFVKIHRKTKKIKITEKCKYQRKLHDRII